MNTSSGDIGYCLYAGHTSSVLLTWNGNTVISVECGSGNHDTCGYAEQCELYQRRPVGFVQTYPHKK